MAIGIEPTETFQLAFPNEAAPSFPCPYLDGVIADVDQREACLIYWPASYVLEVNAGVALRHGAGPGTVPPIALP
jgi:hypothetical protein